MWKKGKKKMMNEDKIEEKSDGILHEYYFLRHLNRQQGFPIMLVQLRQSKSEQSDLCIFISRSKRIIKYVRYAPDERMVYAKTQECWNQDLQEETARKRE